MTDLSTQSSMTTTIARPGPVLDAGEPDLRRTARTTGLLYLAFFITGALGYLVVPDQLFVADDPQATLANLLGSESLTRVLVALLLGIVLTQALTALWFYRLFRSVNSFAAGSVAAFGMVNAAAILVSAAVLATAFEVASDASLAAAGEAAASVQLLFVFSGHLWGVGGIFFGLWLIPMGWLVLRSRWMPRALGWILMVGGAGYLLSAFVAYLLPDADAIVDLLTVPATIGELWIMGYLIFVGIRPPVRQVVVSATLGTG